METRTAKSIYSKFQDLSFLDEGKKEKAITTSGLLTPKNNSAKIDDKRYEQPAYRVAEYVREIRNKREGLNSG